MKKRLFSLVLSFLFLINLISCSEKDPQKKNNIHQYDDMSLSEYLKQTKLPKNLEVAFQPEAVKDFHEVYSYDAVEFFNLDLNSVSNVLLKNPITSQEIWAAGPQAIAETEKSIEYLTVYDGGIAFGNPQGGSFGGLLYHFFQDKNYQNHPHTLFTGEYPDYCFSGAGIDRRTAEGYWGTDIDLDFSTRKEAKDTIYTFLETLGIKDVELNYISAYDYDTIKLFYDWEKSSLEKLQKEYPELGTSFPYPELQKTDEFYRLIGRQLINGIPVNNYDIAVVDPDHPDVRSYLGFVCSSDGIIKADIFHLLKQPEETSGKKETVISASGALNLVQNYYGKGALLEKHTIESLELVYTLDISKDKQTVSLQPCWLARVSYPMRVAYPDDNGKEQTVDLKGYDHLYFHAVTGEYQNFSPSAKNP